MHHWLAINPPWMLPQLQGVEGVLLAAFPNNEGSWVQLAFIFLLKAILAAFIVFFMVSDTLASLVMGVYFLF
jgi:hypothetical protein